MNRLLCFLAIFYACNSYADCGIEDMMQIGNYHSLVYNLEMGDLMLCANRYKDAQIHYQLALFALGDKKDLYSFRAEIGLLTTACLICEDSSYMKAGVSKIYAKYYKEVEPLKN